MAAYNYAVTPGQYQVAITWTADADRATNASYSIYDGDVLLGRVTVNQQQAPSGFTDQGANWKALGTFNITGNSLTVKLSGR